MRNHSTRPWPVFRVLYFSTVFVIVAVLTFAIMKGLGGGEDQLRTAILLGYLSLVFVELPLLVVFIALNLWGFVAHKSRRLHYGLVIAPLMIWVVWSVHECLVLALP